MNVLIISYYFSPINRIASVRMSKAAYTMAKQGHKVEVICYEADNHEKEDMAVSELIGEHENLHINRISWDMDSPAQKRYYKALSVLSKKSAKKSGVSVYATVDFSEQKPVEYSGRSLKANIAGSVLDRLYQSKNRYMAKSARTVVSGLKSDGFKPDIIIGSYEPLVSLLVAKECKHEWPESTLIYDFRDVMTNHYYGKHKGFYEDRMYARLIREEKNLLEECDAVTVVSKGQKQMILDRQSGIDAKKIHVIYNGFDEKESVENAVTKVKDGKMTVVFTGTLQSQKAVGFIYFLKVIREMLSDGQIKPSQIHVKYAGHHAGALRNIAKKLKIEEIMEIYDHIPRDEAISMQKTADFLLNLVWNEQYDKGILGGKFGEYMLGRKPVLGIVTGSLPGSDLYKEIYDRKIGECFETVRGDAERERLKQFIISYLQGKKEYTYRDGAVDDFNYGSIAKAFLSVRGE